MNSFLKFLKRAYLKWVVHIERARYSDDYHRINSAYRIPDPWSLDRKESHLYFNLINEFIIHHCGKLRDILEIGSAEGLHTQHLLEICERIIGIEVSETAISRAKIRCPQTNFICTQFPAGTKSLTTKFNLVIASEMIYFLRDIKSALDEMNRLGQFCVVTCYDKEIPSLDLQLSAIPNLESKIITVGAMRHKIYFWRSICP